MILAHLLDDRDVTVAAPVTITVDRRVLDRLDYQHGAARGAVMLDRQTHRLIQHESNVERQNGDAFVVTNTFSDHRRVDGVLVPFRMRHVEVSAERTTRADFRWRQVELDQPLRDSRFTMP